VKGRALDVSRKSGNRAVCYCKDCQAFARFVGVAGVMDDRGGTDIFQMAPSRLVIDEGLDAIACVRLSEKGLFRWYAGCCKTPIGNMVGPKLPFIGVIHTFMDCASRDEVLGEVRAYVGRKSALGGAVEKKLSLGAILHVTRLLVTWKLRGMGRQSTFFDAKGAPVAAPRVLSHGERASLDAN
jgi:hypothetical protein